MSVRIVLDVRMEMLRGMCVFVGSNTDWIKTCVNGFIMDMILKYYPNDIVTPELHWGDSDIIWDGEEWLRVETTRLVYEKNRDDLPDEEMCSSESFMFKDLLKRAIMDLLTSIAEDAG